MKIERNLMKNLLHTYYTLEKFPFKLLNNNSFFAPKADAVGTTLWLINDRSYSFNGATYYGDIKADSSVMIYKINNTDKTVESYDVATAAVFSAHAAPAIYINDTGHIFAAGHAVRNELPTLRTGAQVDP